MPGSEKAASDVLFVGGASSGIGEAVARHMASRGARVFLVARREDRLKTVCESIRASGGIAAYAAADLADEAAALAAAEACRTEFGAVSGMALATGAALLKPFRSTTSRDMQDLFATNVLSAVNVCRAMNGKFAAKGSVVLFTSPAGIAGAKAMTAYAAAKGALIPFARSLALEWAAQRVRVNVICPGYVETELTQKLYGYATPDQKRALIEAHPLGAGSLEDVSAATEFLLSDAARWITGCVLPVDGGLGIGV